MSPRAIHKVILRLLLFGIYFTVGEAYHLGIRGYSSVKMAKQLTHDTVSRGRRRLFTFKKTTTKSTARDTKPTKKRSLVLPRKWARILYSISALNPTLAVLFNDYSRMLQPFRPLKKQQQHALARTYETIFFFARLKPRVSFAIGAMLRALQLTTALQHVFDPSAGVGLGLDMLSLFARSRWPATLVLGWSATAPAWRALGAHPPSGLPVPIAISMRPTTMPSTASLSGNQSTFKNARRD